MTFFLDLVTPCLTRGKDATREVTMYGNSTTSIIINLRTMECVVEREWRTIDHSGDFARTVFVDAEDDDD
ncbi:hypothetical protein JB92DRAFT_520314 [Gautieria morchelliformis]|nr:hypothetical protein JB92DRAFT_520314 [Gautieria morchelliformis]